MSNTASTIRTKAHDLTPGDVVFTADTDGLLVVEVEHDAGFGTWVTFHNERQLPGRLLGVPSGLKRRHD